MRSRLVPIFVVPIFRCVLPQHKASRERDRLQADYLQGLFRKKVHFPIKNTSIHSVNLLYLFIVKIIWYKKFSMSHNSTRIYQESLSFVVGFYSTLSRFILFVVYSSSSNASTYSHIETPSYQ